MRTGTSLDRFVRANVRRLEPYHCARETVQEGVLLDANENPFPRRQGGVLLNRYPDPFQRELRRALAERLGVPPEMVAAGNGSDEVLDWIFKVFDVRSGVIVAEPTYGMYRVLADIYDAPVHEVRLAPGFRFLADRFLAEAPPEARLLFVCTPNNPTGNLLDRQEILRVAREWEGIVVVDEAYIEFAGAPSLSREVESFPNLVVLRTFSKAWGRAGVRLGYVVADPELTDFFLKVKAPYNLNAWVLDQGVRALLSERETEEQVQRIVSERCRLEQALSTLNGVGPVFPSQANFILFRCPGAREICRTLMKEGIVVRDRSTVRGLEECIRVTVGTPEENDLFLARLKELLERA